MSSHTKCRRSGGRKAAAPVAPTLSFPGLYLRADIAPGAAPCQSDPEDYWQLYMSETGEGDPTTRPSEWNFARVPDVAEGTLAQWDIQDTERFYVARYYGDGEWSPWSNQTYVS